MLNRRAAAAVALGAAIGAALFALFCVANYAGVGYDLPAARAHVSQAFADSTLQDRDFLMGDTAIGTHQFNDCLILRQAIDQRASRAELAVSPIWVPPVAPATQCGMLRGFVAGDPPHGRVFYHRYIHGHTLLARLLLPHLSVGAIRALYQGTLTLIVVAGVALAMVALARGRRPVEGVFWLIVFAVFARWFGLESFGQSLSHGPADIVLLAYLLYLAGHGVAGGIGRSTALASAALFGALTATFEFLTGGIPLGLAAVIGGLPFAMHARAGDGTGERAGVVAAHATLAFCAAVLTCLALKMALAVHMFGIDALTDAAGQLRMRAGLDASHGEGVGLGPVYAVKRLLKGTEALAAGMRPMAWAMIGVALAGGAWGARDLLQSPADATIRTRVVALLSSNAAIVAMLTLLWQHTVIHAWFMERTLAWTIASGFALFALACARRYGADWGAARGAGWAR